MLRTMEQKKTYRLIVTKAGQEPRIVKEGVGLAEASNWWRRRPRTRSCEVETATKAAILAAEQLRADFDAADQKYNAQMLDGCETDDEINAELRAQTQ